MRKFLLAGVASLALGVATPALANDQGTGAVVGGGAGAVTGGTIGFFLGGPIGALIGGFAGASIGASAGISAASVSYAATHPVEAVVVDDTLGVDTTLGADVTITDIEGDPTYGYIYANNRVYIVDKGTRRVVHSPGFVIPEQTVAYIKEHPAAEVTFSGQVAPGLTLAGDFALVDIPDDPNYAYVYIDGRPVLVDRRSRVVVWVG